MSPTPPSPPLALPNHDAGAPTPPAPRTAEALTASSVHALAGAGGGLASRLAARPRPPIARLL